MKQSQVQIGQSYIARVSGKLVVVRIVSESRYGGWNGVNTETKRDVRIKTAARLRGVADNGSHLWTGVNFVPGITNR